MAEATMTAAASRARILRPEGLREAEERFRTAFVQAALPQVLVDVTDGRYVAVNEELCSFLGYEEHELLGRASMEVSFPEDLPRVRELVAQLRAGEIDRFTVDKRYVRKDGAVRYVRAYARLIRDDAGESRLLHALLVDHTRERSAEQALAASETRLRALVEHSDDLVLLVGAHGLIRHAGPNAQRLAPCSTRPDASLFDLVPSAEAPLLRECLTEVALHGGTRRLRLRGSTCCGGRSWDMRLQGGGGADTRLDGIVVTMRDVSAQARTEELAEGEAAILRMLLAGTPQPRVLDALARLLESLYPELRATILVSTSDGRALRHGAAPSMPDEYVAAVEGLPVAMGAGVCGTAAFLNQPVVVENVFTEPSLKEFWGLLERAGVRSTWSLPIAGAGGQVVGTFAMYGTQPSTPDAEQWRVAHRMAYLTGLVICEHPGEPAPPDGGKQAGTWSAPLTELTARELEVLRLLAFGHTNLEVAERLGIGVRTVESHRSALMRKLGIQTRAELVRVALDVGLLRP